MIQLSTVCLGKWGVTWVGKGLPLAWMAEKSTQAAGTAPPTPDIKVWVNLEPRVGKLALVTNAQAL